MQDRVLNCRDCRQDFVFSIGEQEFHAQKGYTQAPVRCIACRRLRKQASPSPALAQDATRPRFPATCSGCGTETTVPFRPVQGRPVYCPTCFRAQRDRPGGHRGTA
ncbi:MAG: zinc-ribbon domain containing protein [Candidatus Sericytochromatia bacterium]|nr:zinc-ribbon domain containing protein [Candidatus Tanganyikabacteria bacterium]